MITGSFKLKRHNMSSGGNQYPVNDTVYCSIDGGCEGGAVVLIT